ncbi:putative nuclease HARBI1 [Ostrea edulis]|uniref:putative nuclease HARBI1 n=1 Tax=Ostrea edulis TaxID=37623 RepID=UPI0024AF26A0|nr:putative nuclease HARBI1 [Ostrea edulis]
MAAFLMLNVMNETHKKHALRVFRDRNNPLDYLNDVEVVERYRLPRRYLYELTDLVRGDVEHPTNRSKAVPAVIQVLATDRCLTKEIFYSECADLHGISKSSVCVAMDRVLASFCHRLQNIKFPSSEEEIRQTKTEFFRKAQFPNVLGAVDGTLIKIQASSDNEPSYVCRKGFHALNVQAVADATLRFTDLVCKWPGAVHDSFVFENSNLYQILSHGCSGWLLGDSEFRKELNSADFAHARVERLFYSDLREVHSDG